ncbi:unnamed protein product [Adineta steineri]|uniref:Uncharacterized protein n=1 Tax=Adineta steineri TaxID=433720 RepID=A0A813ZTB1_9BILA|nr:unnamed protein product [Adineta steineri]CAF1246152.1 unnamed protein product [Adineta steineri]
MHHYLFVHLMIILALLNFCCYSSPISYDDQNDHEQTISPIDTNEQDMMKRAITNNNDKYYFWKMMCALHNDCYTADHDRLIFTDIKPKRLASNLFHGIPKFGKRAFSSAFSGIPKFG